MRTRKPAFLSAFALVALLQACTAHAAPPAFNGPDFSGTYDCTGQDHHEGPYTGTVTLERVADQSTGAHGAYTFSLDVPGYGIYRGHAASRGRQMAIHFALPDRAPATTVPASPTSNAAGPVSGASASSITSRNSRTAITASRTACAASERRPVTKTGHTASRSLIAVTM